MALIEKGLEEHYILNEPLLVKMNFIRMRMKTHFQMTLDEWIFSGRSSIRVREEDPLKCTTILH